MEELEDDRNGRIEKIFTCRSHPQKHHDPPEPGKGNTAFLDDASSKPGATDKPGCPLNHGLACVLCTVHDGMPRATPIDFFVDGMTLWLAGEPGLKIRNIRSNAQVAVGHLPSRGPQRA